MSNGLSIMGHTVIGIKLNTIIDYDYITKKMNSISNYDCVILNGWPQVLVKYLKSHNIPRLIIYDPPIRPISNSRKFKGYWGVCWGQPHKHYYYETTLDNARWSRVKNAMGIKVSKWRTNNNEKILIGIRRELNFDGCNEHNMNRLITTCNDISTNVVMCSRTRASHKYDMQDWPKYKSKIVVKTIKQFKYAKCLVTTGGTMVPKSIIAGLPCYYTDHTIADPLLMTKDLKRFISNPDTPDRSKWLNWCGYQQWTCKEIESGAAFDYIFHVKGKVYDF